MIKVLSYGGGLDSYTMLLKAIARGENPDVVVFVDVADGAPDRENIDPGEWPSTYRHIREYVMPLCRQHGIEFVWLTHEMEKVRDARSLFAWLKARLQIPVAGPDRICTNIAKVERFERWMQKRFPGEEVQVWIGFETGEEDRVAKDPNGGKKCSRCQCLEVWRSTRRPAPKSWTPKSQCLKCGGSGLRAPKPGEAVRRNRFPLMDDGLCRCQCELYVRSLGLPVPRKSACVFCPYGSKGDWQTFERELPDWFAETETLERDKPPTVENNRKLSIMGYRTIYDQAQKKLGRKVVLRVVAPPLREFIKGGYRRQIDICGVCGQHRATKATGCDYLSEAA